MPVEPDIDRILGYLGLAGRPPEPKHRPEPIPEIGGFRVVSENGAEWCEIGEADDLVRMTRAKAKVVLDQLPRLVEWSEGGEPSGRDANCRWTPVVRYGAHLLELKPFEWKPLRLSRRQAAMIVERRTELGIFVRSGSSTGR